MRAIWKPRPCDSYSAASSAHRSSIVSTGSSRSCAITVGCTGSVAAITIASIACLASLLMRLRPPALYRPRGFEVPPGLRSAHGSSHLLLNRLHGRAILVAPLFERRQVERDAFSGRERPHDKFSEASDLVEIDDTLLEQFEDREESHDHFELHRDTERELLEPDRAVAGQEREHALDGVAHTGTHRRDVLGVDFFARLRCEPPPSGLEQLVEREPFE